MSKQKKIEKCCCMTNAQSLSKIQLTLVYRDIFKVTIPTYEQYYSNSEDESIYQNGSDVMQIWFLKSLFFNYFV